MGPQEGPPMTATPTIIVPTPRSSALLDRPRLVELSTIQTAAILATHIARSPAGTLMLSGAPARGWIVSLTNNVVPRVNTGSLLPIVRLARGLWTLNEPLRSKVALGWWTDHAGLLYVDAGIVAANQAIARCVGRAFAQASVAHLGESGVNVVDVRPAIDPLASVTS